MLRQSKTKEAYLSRAWRSLKDGKRGKRMSMEKTIDHHYLADLWEEQGGICPLTGLTLTHKAALCAGKPTTCGVSWTIKNWWNGAI
jgi:hypothetical protein